MVWVFYCIKIYIRRIEMSNKQQKELEEIYEALVGDNGMERFTHAEIIDWIYQLIDDESLEYINKKDEKNAISNNE